MQKCPTCGTENAYVGIYKIECLDQRCKNYSKSWTKEYLKSELLKKETQEDLEIDFSNIQREIDEVLNELEEMDNP